MVQQSGKQARDYRSARVSWHLRVWWTRLAVIASVVIAAGIAVAGTRQPPALGTAGAANVEAGVVTESELRDRASFEVVSRYAMQHNPAIRAARHAWEAARQQITERRAYENPMVTYGPDTGNMAETRAGPQGDTVGFAQAIPFPGKLSLRGDIADQQARATHERLRAVIQEVARQTRRRYAAYYLAARSLGTNAETSELMRQFAAIAEQKFQVGTAAEQDVILAQEQLSRLAAERVVFQSDEQSALGTLNAVLDRAPRAALAVPKTLPVGELAAGLAQLVTAANTRRPELRSQDHLVEASRRSLRLAKMGYLPDFSIGAQYTAVQGGTNPGFPQDGHDIWMAELGFSVPIWIDRVRAGVDEQDARVMQEESLRRDLTNQVNDEVQRAYERVRAAARTEKIYRTTLIPQTQERISAARAGYQTGIVDFLTLIDSLKSLEGVRLDDYRAVRDFQQAIADLSRAVGQPVSELCKSSGTAEGGRTK